MTLTKLDSAVGGFEYVNMEQGETVEAHPTCYHLNILSGETLHISKSGATITALMQA